ncbi:MAG: FAD-dependent oxidoreductase, partial [Myxococcota bacterium]|nr:FAD-dependent oxidoreductase [Myxococcota bacterium]
MAEVVVVGGGLAGLACAHRLEARGHRVEVFERDRAPGGRLRTRREEDFVLEPADAPLLRGDPHLDALRAGIGLADACVEGDPRRAILRGG